MHLELNFFFPELSTKEFVLCSTIFWERWQEGLSVCDDIVEYLLYYKCLNDMAEVNYVIHGLIYRKVLEDRIADYFSIPRDKTPQSEYILWSTSSSSFAIVCASHCRSMNAQSKELCISLLDSI